MAAPVDPNLGLLAAAALIAGGLSTAAARRVARWTGVLDRPDGGRKLHREPTPLMGGVAIYLSMAAVLAVASQLPASAAVLATLPTFFLPTVLVSGGLFCALGLYDDIRPMTAAPKLAGQFAAAVPFAAFGTEVRLVEFCGLDLTIGPVLGVLFVACWIVACVNTINLVDGLDGLAGSIGLISCVGIAVIADLQGMTGVAAVALIAAGGLTGFLCHNLPPARIFLGDSGSLLIGFLIAALSSAATAKTATGFALTVPLILVSVPAFDTCMAIARRRLNGRRIGEGDRGHIHHLLQQRGLTRTQTLTVIAGLCTAMATLTVLSIWYRADRACLGLCLGVLGLLIVGRVFGHAETALLLQRVQKIGQLIWARSNIFGFGRGLGDPIGWDAAVTRAARLGATRLESLRWDERTGAVLDRQGWVPEPQPLPAWELRSTVAAAAGERVTVVAFGVRAPSRRLQSLLDRCCRVWATRPPAASTGVLPLAAVRPASSPAETAEPTRKAA